MEGPKFDRLTRALAGRTGRRAAIRAALGIGAAAAIGAREASAAAAGPGDVCSRASQCVNAYGSTYYCDDNGFDYDGPTNCCTYEWGGCSRNEECCGGLSCINGACRFNQGLAGAGKGCYANRDCTQYGGVGLICDFNDWDNSARVCCSPYGGACQYDGHCCGSNGCNYGVCG